DGTRNGDGLSAVGPERASRCDRLPQATIGTAQIVRQPLVSNEVDGANVHFGSKADILAMAFSTRVVHSTIRRWTSEKAYCLLQTRVTRGGWLKWADRWLQYFTRWR